ncbi:hypothetical protein [Schlesneria paludicola]|uniref:hypothetical protein n=1 Tax=Schlesneria paludicola TaxID=360056 RepID=UPI00029A14C3|nr:hypothetical protein [Schlesneria paludicola]
MNWQAERRPSHIVAVFERQPFWGPELQRQFKQSSVEVRECRVVGDLLPTIEEFPSALIFIDLESGLEECLSWLRSELRVHPHPCPVIACGAATATDLAWVLREAGVTALLAEFVPGEKLARLCRRQLGLQPRPVR